MSVFDGKTLLITGGTGSFGNAVLNRFLKTDIGEIRIFSRDEKKQDDMRHDFQTRMPEVAEAHRGQEPLRPSYERKKNSIFIAAARDGRWMMEDGRCFSCRLRILLKIIDNDKLSKKY